MSLTRGATVVAVAVLVLAVLSGCESAGAGDGGGTPVQTIQWDLDGDGFYQFSTNDSENYNYGFYYPRDAGGTPTDPQTFAIDVKKISGDAGQGFGIVFDYKDNVGYSRLLMSQYGNYVVSSSTVDSGGTWSTTYFTGTSANRWVSSNGAIKTGDGEVNRVSITVNRASGTVDITINGAGQTQITGYTDLGGTGYGGYASVGDETDEDFPDTPVDVRFKPVQ